MKPPNVAFEVSPVKKVSGPRSCKFGLLSLGEAVSPAAGYATTSTPMLAQKFDNLRPTASEFVAWSSSPTLFVRAKSTEGTLASVGPESSPNFDAGNNASVDFFDNTSPANNDVAERHFEAVNASADLFEVTNELEMNSKVKSNFGRIEFFDQSL